MSGTRTYLELTNPTVFHPAWSGVPAVRVDRVEGCPSSFFRYLYQEVGRAYGWIDRLVWTDEAIARHLADPAVSLWVMTVANAPAGYFELRRERAPASNLPGDADPARDGSDERRTGIRSGLWPDLPEDPLAEPGGQRVRAAGGSVEIAYFGLLPEFVGRGLGAHLLSAAVERAFESGARRVWLHTCTKDNPAALPNYLKRGFVPFRTEPL
jgi:GNAT superfamily N-acetyltransferase